MSRTLLVAEHDGAALNGSTARSLTAAVALGQPVDIVVFATAPGAIAKQAASLAGVERVLTSEQHADTCTLAANLAPQIVSLSSDYSHVLMPSTTFGKDVLPRVAALLGVPQVSDMMAVLGPRRFERPIYAGNVIVTVEVPEACTVLATVRTASFQAAASSGAATIVAVESAAEPPRHTRFIELTGGSSDRPDLQSSARVVSGGRGVGSEDQFQIIYRLAEKLDAAVGASRAAVDAGFVPNELQVGQTGKIIAPDLYVAVGISGAIQHVTGIKDAGTIVAINKDPDAPIFEIADLGLVGDLFQVLPELEEKL
jgi:electron transfer flavoprotein alpha subunit